MPVRKSAMMRLTASSRVTRSSCSNTSNMLLSSVLNATVNGHLLLPPTNTSPLRRTCSATLSTCTPMILKCTNQCYKHCTNFFIFQFCVKPSHFIGRLLEALVHGRAEVLVEGHGEHALAVAVERLVDGRRESVCLVTRLESSQSVVETHHSDRCKKTQVSPQFS